MRLVSSSQTEIRAGKKMVLKQMDLYLTSTDWIYFGQSQKIQSLERIKVSLFSYLMVTLNEPIFYSHAKHRQLLLTSTFHFIRPDFHCRLPLSLNVFTLKRDNKNKMRCGDLVGKEVDLHTKIIH
ncbi:hypothetical protein CNR22_01260 [Sphingobacteriaceae bacterium]|nr:hypothetical protein CNR22_01260 [Sphingobacteriaceae bacterium]